MGNVMILVIGFWALVKGADFFVDGSAALAKNFRISSLVIGLTIVAAGTSAPELAVSTTAALQGANEIALSNVVGSNIFNLLCVLGACAVICPVSVGKAVLTRDFPVSMIATMLVLLAVGALPVFSGRIFKMGMEEHAGKIGKSAGIFLVILFLVYMICLIIDAKKHPEKEPDIEKRPIWKCALGIAEGLVLIVGGGQGVVYSAKEIARAFGMTETLIGLTIVAVGTSLPELVTSVVAARKGETGLAVGNVIGSNIFNLLFILGISAMIHPVTVNAASIYDMGILMLASLLTLLFLARDKTLKRAEGAVMLAIYIADVIFAMAR